MRVLFGGRTVPGVKFDDGKRAGLAADHAGARAALSRPGAVPIGPRMRGRPWWRPSAGARRRSSPSPGDYLARVRPQPGGTALLPAGVEAVGASARGSRCSRPESTRVERRLNQATDDSPARRSRRPAALPRLGQRAHRRRRARRRPAQRGRPADRRTVNLLMAIAALRPLIESCRPRSSHAARIRRARSRRRGCRRRRLSRVLRRLGRRRRFGPRRADDRVNGGD
jgi:hypothetical protein